MEPIVGSEMQQPVPKRRRIVLKSSALAVHGVSPMPAVCDVPAATDVSMSSPSTPRRRPFATRLVGAANTPTRQVRAISLSPGPTNRSAPLDYETPVKCQQPRVISRNTPSPTKPLSTSIIGREQEKLRLRQFLTSSLGAKCGKAMYVSGGPGTGKTCSVRAVAAEWLEQEPNTKYIEVNCMGLQQKSIDGLFNRLMDIAGASGSRANVRGTSLTGMASAVAEEITAGFGSAPVLLVVDEVDQLARRSASSRQYADAYDTLFALPGLCQGALISIIAIANSVDLLEKGRSSSTENIAACESLLFEAYTAAQLRDIVKGRLASSEHGQDAEQSLGRVAIELRVRQVAKQSGDCRQIIALCEQGLFAARQSRSRELPVDASSAATSSTAVSEQRQEPTSREQPGSSSGSGGGGAVASGGCANNSSIATPSVPAGPLPGAGEPRRLPVAAGAKDSRRNPLADVRSMPMEQQMLLCVLAGAEKETMPFEDVRTRYKEFCKRLFKNGEQSVDLCSHGMVGVVLTALEQQGLLAISAAKGSQGRGRQLARRSSDTVVELAVGRKSVRETLARANPLLERCLQ